jgi:long-chain acyl-CoA synthetase
MPHRGADNVPLYTTYARENLVYVTKHAEARAMFVSNPEMLAEMAEWIGETEVVTVILAEGEGDGASLPDGIRLITLDALREEGRASGAANPDELKQLRDAIEPHDLATLIYTSGTTGLPKGVMLSHENLSCNALTVPLGAQLPEEPGGGGAHVPPAHPRFCANAPVRARRRQDTRSSTPIRIGSLSISRVQPTVFATVPRVLEKVYDKVQLGVQQSSGAKKVIGSWALGLARDYQTGTDPAGVYALKLAVADKLVYSKLREKLGLTRIKAVGVGGAALRADLCDTFNAFGIPAIQGYGLTETSPVITINTPDRNRAGTVGQPIPGVEVAIAEDGEILSRGPHIMQGYYKGEDQTREVIDSEEWFHTGDIGEFTPEGYLKITDRKKALFKLSTGKYVIPQPIENRLMESPSSSRPSWWAPGRSSARR